MPVDSEHASFTEMMSEWRKVRDVYDGSKAIKGERDTDYLPMSQENNPVGKREYEEYKTRALFYNATARTINGLAGSIFQKAVEVDGVSEEVMAHLDDITGNDVPFEQFALLSTREFLLMGRWGVLVEIAREQEGGKLARPYWLGYRAESIFAWRYERQSGRQVLTGVALMEEVDADLESGDDAIVSDSVRQIKLLLLKDGVYQQRRFQKPEDNKDWVEVFSEGQDEPFVPLRRGSPLEFIPFRFLGGADVSKPTLIDLIDVNISHYQSSAEREESLFMVSQPTPVVVGAPKEGGPMKIGSRIAWELADGGSAFMLEHRGEGIGAIRENMEEKKALMATLGARLLEGQTRTDETATAVIMRHSGDHATLRTVAQEVEQGLTQALRWHAWWVGTEATPADVEALVELNKDFVNIRATPQEVQVWLTAMQSGAISFETFYRNIREGELTRPGVDAEEERRQIEREGGGEPRPLVTDDDEGGEESR